MYIFKILSVSELEFEIFTLISGLGFWIFGFFWLAYGHHSNVFLGLFLLLLGLSLNVISFISGVSQYRKLKIGIPENSTKSYSSTKNKEKSFLTKMGEYEEF